MEARHRKGRGALAIRPRLRIEPAPHSPPLRRTKHNRAPSELTRVPFTAP